MNQQRIETQIDKMHHNALVIHQMKMNQVYKENHNSKLNHNERETHYRLMNQF